MISRLKNQAVALNDKGKRYYKPLRYPEIPLDIQDLYIITVSGDRLDLLANQFYNDVRLWWIIPSANPDKVRRDSYALQPGIELRVPTNQDAIIKEFERINKVQNY